MYAEGMRKATEMENTAAGSTPRPRVYIGARMRWGQAHGEGRGGEGRGPIGLDINLKPRRAATPWCCSALASPRLGRAQCVRLGSARLESLGAAYYGQGQGRAVRGAAARGKSGNAVIAVLSLCLFLSVWSVYDCLSTWPISYYQS